MIYTSVPENPQWGTIFTRVYFFHLLNYPWGKWGLLVVCSRDLISLFYWLSFQYTYLLAYIMLSIYSCFEKGCRKSARDNPEKYCGWFCLPYSPKKFERMAREATDICSQVLKESNKSRFSRYSRLEQCIDHISYYLSGLSRAYFFQQPLLK